MTLRDNKSKIAEFTFDVCKLLGIDQVSVSLVRNLPTLSKTMMAVYEPATNRIEIRDDLHIYDCYMAIAHECRHAYQRTKQDLSESYIPIAVISSIDKYNEQELEIDAIAFSLLIMDEWLNVKPTLDGLNTSDIMKRKEDLRKEYFN